jgi:hypothetical protein
MATVKISQLPVLSQLSANNANTVFVAVDKTTNTTSQFSTTTLASGLFANNVLNVGTDAATIYADAIAQFVSNTAPSSRVFFQNINPKGTGQIVIATTDGDESNGFINMGVRGSNMDVDAEFDLPNRDGFICMHGKNGEVYGNLWIGTHNSNNDIVFYTGAHKQANEVARIEDGVGLSLKMPIKFADNTIQNTAAVTAAHSQVIFNEANSAYNFAINVNTYAAAIYAQSNTQSNSITVIEGVNLTQNTNITTANNQAWAAFDAANTNSSNIAILQAVDTTQNTNITTANNHAWAAFDKANTALANTTGIFDGTLTITGDLGFDGTASILATDDMFIGSDAGVQIQTDNGGVQKQFQFGIDGNLSVPNYIVFPDNTEIGYNPSASPTSFMVSTANTLTLEANTYTWTFGADGTTVFPNGLIKTRTNQSIGILAIDGGSLSEYPAQLMAQQVAQAQPDTVISSYDNRATIQTDVNGTIKTWTFGRNGTTTFPTNITIDYSGNNVQFPRLIADSGKAFSIQGQGANGSAALAWSIDHNADTQYAAVGVNRGGDDLAKVILTAGNTTPTLKVWKFDQTGAFTFPDLSVQNTAFTGTAIDQNATNLAQSAYDKANTTITISQLKSISANAGNFGDFQIAIAAL